MEHVSTPRKSVWRQTVPQAISNSAMVAMVTLCYFGLVSPTLNLVQTAQLVQANVRLNNDFGFAYTVVDPSKASALNSQIKSVVLQQPIATATSAPATLQLVTTTNGSIKEVVAVNAPTSPDQSGPSVSIVDPVKVKEEVSISALNAVYTESDYKPSAEPSLNPGNPLSSDSTMPMEPVEVSEEISADNYTTAIPESIAEIERLQIELDKLTAVMREAYALMNDSTLSAEKKEVIAGDINELKADIADTMQQQFGHMMGKDGYIPTGHFVTTPNDNGMNNWSNSSLGAPPVNTQNNGVNSSRPTVSTPKPPVVLPSFSSLSSVSSVTSVVTTPNNSSSILHQSASEGVTW